MSDVCYICGKETFGRCEFSCFGINPAERFLLCKECYFNFIKAINVSADTVRQAKGHISTMINSKNASVGNQLRKVLEKAQK